MILQDTQPPARLELPGRRHASEAQARGKLTGLLIEASSFRGWNSVGALIEHLTFVYHHHRKIDRLAVVTNDTVLKIAPRIAQAVVHPEIKVFTSGERRALAWLQTGAS